MTASARRRIFGPGTTRPTMLRVGLLLAALALVLVVFDPISASPASATIGSSGPAYVRVSGNELVNKSGAAIRLIGVDQSGAESNCVHGEGFGIPSTATTIQTMITSLKGWKIDAVRLPLNEDCWLGINNLPKPQDGGAPYRSAVTTYVKDLTNAGLAVIVDLHWGAPGTELATGKEPMADESHAPTFWKSVAGAFKSDLGVLFDLYNEPETDISFTCLLQGCTVNGAQVAGYDQLIGDVRGTGATNVIMLAGTNYAANPDGFIKDWPIDGDKQLAISIHAYNFNGAKEPGTWARWKNEGLLSKAPIITGELGEIDCTDNFINSYMTWADANKVSYLAWAFNVGTCKQPFLLQNANGTPNAYGAVYKAHIATLSS